MSNSRTSTPGSWLPQRIRSEVRVAPEARPALSEIRRSTRSGRVTPRWESLRNVVRIRESDIPNDNRKKLSRAWEKQKQKSRGKRTVTAHGERLPREAAKGNHSHHIEIALLEGAAKTYEDRLVLDAAPRRLAWRDVVAHDKDILGGAYEPLLLKLAAWVTTQSHDGKQDRMGRSGKPPVYLLHPYGWFMLRWDFVTTVALLFTAIVTPFEVGFMDSPETPDTLFVLNRIVDVVFIFDMVIQFFLMYRRSGGGDGIDATNAAWETSLRRIARRYLFGEGTIPIGWFYIDFFSIVPSYFDIEPLVRGNDPASGTTSETLKAVRVARALRLFKLVRLFRTSRVLRRLEIMISMPYHMVTFVALNFMIALLSHYYACALGMMASVFSTPLRSWQATHGYCITLNVTAAALAVSEDDVDNLDFACVAMWDLYMQSFYWGVTMIAGYNSDPQIGPHPIYTSPCGPGTVFTRGEQVLLVFLYLLAAFQWAYVTGMVVDIICNMDPDGTKFRNGLNQLNDYASFYRLSRNVRIELREYYHAKKDWYKAQSRSTVAESFSPSLAQKVVWESYRDHLVRAPCFRILCVGPKSVEMLELELDMAATKRAASYAARNRQLRRSGSGGIGSWGLSVDERQRRRANLIRREQLHSQARQEAKGFLVHVALAMRNEVYAPTDRLPTRRLYLVVRGSVMYCGKILGVGESFGEQDVLLRGDSFTVSEADGSCMVRCERRRPQAHAVTFLQVQYIGPDDLAAIAAYYPKAYASVRRVAVFRAIRIWLKENLRHQRRLIRIPGHRISTGGLVNVLRAKRAFKALLQRRAMPIHFAETQPQRTHRSAPQLPLPRTATGADEANELRHLLASSGELRDLLAQSAQVIRRLHEAANRVLDERQLAQLANSVLDERQQLIPPPQPSPMPPPQTSPMAPPQPSQMAPPVHRLRQVLDSQAPSRPAPTCGARIRALHEALSRNHEDPSSP